MPPRRHRDATATPPDKVPRRPRASTKKSWYLDMVEMTVVASAFDMPRWT